LIGAPPTWRRCWRRPCQRSTALFSAHDGRVYGLDLASGKKVWEYEAASPVTSSPAVAKGKVVAATADGQVICFG
jgi:outer membrane protein assembly factor BamB